MKENTSLPASIRERIELAQQYVDRGQYESADNVMKEMARTLASSAPELCALLIAAQMGNRGFQAIKAEATSTARRVERRAFGFCVGEDIETTSQSRTSTVTYRLLK